MKVFFSWLIIICLWDSVSGFSCCVVWSFFRFSSRLKSVRVFCLFRWNISISWNIYNWWGATNKCCVSTSISHDSNASRRDSLDRSYRMRLMHVRCSLTSLTICFNLQIVLIERWNVDNTHTHNSVGIVIVDICIINVQLVLYHRHRFISITLRLLSVCLFIRFVCVRLSLSLSAVYPIQYVVWPQFAHSFCLLLGTSVSASIKLEA